MSVTHCDCYTEARAHLKDLLDAAERGYVATVQRDAARTAVVDVDRFRSSLASLSIPRAQVVAEADGWSVFIPRLPIAADGATFDGAIAEMIVALREYAEDWLASANPPALGPITSPTSSHNEWSCICHNTGHRRFDVDVGLREGRARPVPVPSCSVAGRFRPSGRCGAAGGTR
ncbi:MAG: hypothetical protein ACRDT2_06815 [Natronosporangium sp.]